MYLWNTNQLAIALANDELSSEQKFKYLLAGNIIYAGSGYLGSLFGVASAGWLYWYEAFMVIVVTYYGLVRCKIRYKPIKNDRLLENCVVLGVPISIKLLLFSWAAYYLCRAAMKWVVHSLSFSGLSSSNEGGFDLIAFALNAANNFYPFLIAVLGTLWYYWRLGLHLEATVVGPMPLVEQLVSSSSEN